VTEPRRPWWLEAADAGFRAVGVLAALGVFGSLAVWAAVRPGYGAAAALRIGLLYLAPFHRVPARIFGEFDLGAVAQGAVGGATTGATFVEVGVALLLVTALGAWLLFRAGRRIAGGLERPDWLRVLAAASAAPAYALPVWLVAVLVRVEEPLALGSRVPGRVELSIAVVPWIVFPLLTAAAAAAAGGLWAVGGERARAVFAGGWRMLWVGLALAYGGLFVAGTLQPDEPVALLTPSTARYFGSVFDRPAVGTAVVAHHLALAPNEAVWALVPAMGGCDVVRGDEDGDLLCYGTFPRSAETALGEPPSGFGRAPVGYLAFLLVPAAATVLGGRGAARRASVSGRAGAALGAASGVVFAAALAATSLLSSVSLEYGTAVGERAGGGSIWAGPHPVAALALGLVWGVAGGALGGATARLRSGAPSGPAARASR
jgi:hypothetical protein